MELNLRSFLFGIGFVQAVFLFFVLWQLQNKQNQGVIQILSYLILSFCWFLLDEFSEASGLSLYFPKFSTSSFTIDLALGPLVYLLVRKNIRQEAQVFQRDWAHLLPFLVGTILYLGYHFSVPFDKILFRNPDLKLLASALVNVKFAHLLFYHFWALYLLLQVEKPLPGKLLALKKLVIAVLTLLVVNLMVYNFNSFGFEWLIDADFVANAFLTVTLFMMVFTFIRQPDMLHEVQSVASFALKYRTSPLDEKKKIAYHHQLLQMMEAQKLFLDAELRLEEVANKLGISPYYLSQILSEIQAQNFYEFINTYRVKEAQELIESPRNDHKTLLALGLEAGFNSKTSFNRAFKKYVGMTPSEYKEQIMI
ncbi:MAG: helix-turn-helix transcriptional regulator [Saprospiraceae bacterium]|nr:helix-turn-helix transcriptional regulator [Saprospiraceae bacterium]